MENKGKGREVGCWVTANILDDVESMALDEVFYSVWETHEYKSQNN